MISTELMNCAVLYTATTKADKQLFRRSSRNNQQHNQATEEVSGDRDSNFLTTQHVQQPKVCKKKKKRREKKKKRSWSPPSQSPQQTAKAERPLWLQSKRSTSPSAPRAGPHLGWLRRLGGSRSQGVGRRGVVRGGRGGLQTSKRVQYSAAVRKTQTETGFDHYCIRSSSSKGVQYSAAVRDRDGVRSLLHQVIIIKVYGAWC